MAAFALLCSTNDHVDIRAAALSPNPGSRPFQRLNRAEYARGVKDLLDIDIDVASLGKLGALSGVREFPARVKCASLSWHTLQAALNHAGSKTTTEGP